MTISSDPASFLTISLDQAREGCTSQRDLHVFTAAPSPNIQTDSTDRMSIDRYHLQGTGRRVTGPGILPFLVALFSVVVTLSNLGAPELRAQADIYQVGNDWVAAHVNVEQRTGRFWISAGPKKGWYQFLFHGNKSSQMITSNIVFWTRQGTQVRHYTNNPEGFFSGRPMIGFDTVDFLPFRGYRLAEDTIEIYYNLRNLYDVTVRLVAEPPATQYDNGADVLIEFEYHVNPNSPGGTMGVMLMLDGDNGAANGPVGGEGDRTSIMTTDGYFDRDKTGYTFPQRERPMPDFYHVGNFRYHRAYNERNRILPIHRLTGLSNGGLPLTEPDILGIGNWKLYRTTAWNPGIHNSVGDVATALQWDTLAGHGLVRTAFGTNNEGRNNIYTCRDEGVFADIRTKREIRQISENGPYETEEFEVEMWVTNTVDYGLLNSKIRLENPIESFPDGTERLLLDPSTPREQEIVLNPTFTRRLVWKVRLNPNSVDTLARLNFTWRDEQGVFRPFIDACAPLVTIRPFSPPPTDTIPPVIERLGIGRDTKLFWNFDTYDRHPGFDYDTGLDSIWVIENPGANFRLVQNPKPFRQCDISETVRLRFEVIDTLTSAYVLFAVRDCNGNVSLDSIRYRSRPDPYTPDIIRRDSTGSWDPVAWPCNARVRIVDVYDNVSQTAETANYGLGGIEVLSWSNFRQPVITNQRGVIGGPILDFDSTARISLEVLDTLSNAVAEIRVHDYVGNDTILYFYYCTIDDFTAPKIRRTGNSATKWELSVTDSAAWDRGLLEVEEIEASNVRYIWPDGTRRDSLPALTKGSRVSTLGVEIIDRCEPARLILEYRDLEYAKDPARHATRDTITYAGIPDTLAPNVVITPGFDGRTYTFDAVIDDIHYPGGILFECDRGLEVITITTTANIGIRTPLDRPDIYNATVSFEVLDTLAIDRTDTICITAVDSVGNRTTVCTYWPTTPDRNSPVFTGIYDRSQGAIVGRAWDTRENDRGLASVDVRNEINVLSVPTLLGLNGRGSTPVNIPVPDPEEYMAGELVLRDLYGQLVNSPESAIHTVVIPFELPVVKLSLEMPELIDSWTEFEVPIRSEGRIEQRTIESISFEVERSGPARYLFVQGSSAVRGAFTVTQGANDRLIIRYEPAIGEVIEPGTILGTLRFEGVTASTEVVPFRMRILPGSLMTNDGADTTILVYGRVGDTLASQLRLPAPLLRLAADSVTWINGECNRALSSFGAGKPHGLAILSVEPNVVGEERREIRLLVRDLPEQGGEVEWIGPDGRVVGRSALSSEGVEVGRYTIPTPHAGPSGLYLLRIRAGEETTSAQVLIVR